MTGWEFLSDKQLTRRADRSMDSTALTDAAEVFDAVPPEGCSVIGGPDWVMYTTAELTSYDASGLALRADGELYIRLFAAVLAPIALCLAILHLFKGRPGRGLPDTLLDNLLQIRSTRALSDERQEYRAFARFEADLLRRLLLCEIPWFYVLLVITVAYVSKWLLLAPVLVWVSWLLYQLGNVKQTGRQFKPAEQYQSELVFARLSCIALPEFRRYARMTCLAWGGLNYFTILASQLRGMGRPEEALALMDQAWDAFPKKNMIQTVDFLLQRGAILLNLDRREEAFAALDRVDDLLEHGEAQYSKPITRTKTFKRTTARLAHRAKLTRAIAEENWTGLLAMADADRAAAVSLIEIVNACTCQCRAAAMLQRADIWTDALRTIEQYAPPQAERLRQKYSAAFDT